MRQDDDAVRLLDRKHGVYQDLLVLDRLRGGRRSLMLRHSPFARGSAAVPAQGTPHDVAPVPRGRGGIHPIPPEPSSDSIR